MRGVDGLCTELLGTRKYHVAQLLEVLEKLQVALTENLELETKEPSGRAQETGGAKTASQQDQRVLRQNQCVLRQIFWDSF